MKYRLEFILILAFKLCVSFILISSQAWAKVPENVLVIGEYGSISSLDPAFIGHTMDIMLSRNISQSLLRYKFNTSEIEGELAKSWTISPNGLIFTFKLRDDVNWHKGFGKFTAKDVKFTYDRILDPKTGSAGRSQIVKEIKEIRVIDDYTVEFHLNYPCGPFLHVLVGPRPTAIVSQKAVEKLGKDFGRNPIGTGPFVFESWTREQIVFLSNKDFQQRQGPSKIDKIIYKIIPDTDTLVMAMERGDIDVITILPREQVVHDRLKAKGIMITNTKRPMAPHLHFNVTKKPFDDVRIRRAIAHAIDKDSLVQYVLSGKADRLDSPVPKEVFGHTEQGIPRYDYNPEKAKQLLVEAGYPNGFEMIFDTSTSSGHLPIATAIAEQLRKVNISAKLVVTDVSTWWGKVSKGNTDFTLNIQSFQPVPDFTLMRYYHSSAFPPGVNVCRYDKIDNLLEKTLGEREDKRRLEYFYQIQKKFMEDLPCIPLMNIHYPIAHKSHISGMPEVEFISGIDFYNLQFKGKR